METYLGDIIARAIIEAIKGMIVGVIVSTIFWVIIVRATDISNKLLGLGGVFVTALFITIYGTGCGAAYGVIIKATGTVMGRVWRRKVIGGMIGGVIGGMIFGGVQWQISRAITGAVWEAMIMGGSIGIIPGFIFGPIVPVILEMMDKAIGGVWGQVVSGTIIGTISGLIAGGIVGLLFRGIVGVIMGGIAGAIIGGIGGTIIGGIGFTISEAIKEKLRSL